MNIYQKKDLRIRNHPIIEFKRGKKITFFFDTNPIEAYENESIASALLASGINVFRYSKRYNRPRGIFCSIGKCSSCLMRVDGIPNVKTCIMHVKDDMHVERQKDGELPENKEFIREKEEVIESDIAVIGAGPAGMSAALTASCSDVDIVLVDENAELGGQLVKQTHKFFGSKEHYAGLRGIHIADKLRRDILKNEKIRLYLNTSAIGYYGYDEGKHTIGCVQNNKRFIEIKAKKVIVSTGARENMLTFEGNDLPGVIGAGGLQTIVNVYGVKPCDKMLMVGAGNIGLIVSYQMMQAGIDVKLVVEAMPKIGGYLVHASKLRRLGVPILTSHTIKRVYGKEHVEGATIVSLDKNWNPIDGSEFDVDVDLVCLSVGLTPSSELLFQAGCKSAYIPELGGWVAWHNRKLETNIHGIYVAGDASGIEEASTAMMEGKISAVDAVFKLGKGNAELRKIGIDAETQLDLLRTGIFGEKPKIGKLKLWSE